jgi:very-short-patch-repair endonuclease
MGAPRLYDYSPKHCENCGRLFERASNQRGARWAERRFCSYKCSKVAYSREMRSKRERKPCAICGEVFGVRPGHNLVTCGKPECKIRYKREIAAKKQAETVRAQFASGARKPGRGYSVLEESLWEHLRKSGWVWRLKWKQDGGWVEMDLALMDRKLNVELDGREHRFMRRRTLDEARDKELAARGWKVLRIPNAEVDASPEAVAKRILAWAA